MAFKGTLGDAAPLANKLSQLSNDVLGLRALIDNRFAEVERLYRVDIALRAGALSADEAVRLMARPDVRTVSQVVTEVCLDRVGGVRSLEERSASYEPTRT
jgi:hypothetical protein